MMLARRRGLRIDERSLEVIAGRWFIEQMGGLATAEDEGEMPVHQ